MNIAAIVMVLIILSFIFKSINRSLVNKPIPTHLISGVDAAIVIGAILWGLEYFRIIQF
jgi:hypothetical protein